MHLLFFWFYILLFCPSGKGVSLARYIQSLQRSKSSSGPVRSPADSCLTSGYISEESDDSSFSLISMDDNLVFNDDMESDGTSPAVSAGTVLNLAESSHSSYKNILSSLTLTRHNSIQCVSISLSNHHIFYIAPCDSDF